MDDIILPPGWFSKVTEDGLTYYYDVKGRVSWVPPPARPNAPGKIISFAEEARSKLPRRKHSHSDDDDDHDDHHHGYHHDVGEVEHWVEDPNDFGLPWAPPPPLSDLTEAMAEVASSMAKTNPNYRGRHEVAITAWGGEPHPRLGTGERLRLGYRPPPPFEPKDKVKEAAQDLSKNSERECELLLF